MKTLSLRLGPILPALWAAAWGCMAPHAAAQSAYPSKNVQMIVPYTPGGSIDILSRAVAQRLGEAWARNVVVDNRPGASGMIGTEIVTKAEPDGHTLLGHTSSYPATAAVRAKLPFDPGRAIVPVAMFAKAPMLLAVHPSVPAKSVTELVALAKKNPGYSYELWWGMFAPAGLPAERLSAINTAVTKILAADDMTKFLVNEGAQPWPLTPAQLDGLLIKEIDRYKKAAQVAGIPPQ